MIASFSIRRFGAMLLLAACLAPAGGRAASFDCATNTVPDEKAICADCALAQLDVKMATMYQFLARTSAMGARGDLQDAQRDWLAERARCGSDIACLTKAYTRRIGALEGMLNDFYARGPY